MAHSGSEWNALLTDLLSEDFATMGSNETEINGFVPTISIEAYDSALVWVSIKFRSPIDIAQALHAATSYQMQQQKLAWHSDEVLLEAEAGTRIIRGSLRFLACSSFLSTQNPLT